MTTMNFYVTFLLSCVNSNIGNKATHLWWHKTPDGTKIPHRCRQVRIVLKWFGNSSNDFTSVYEKIGFMHSKMFNQSNKQKEWKRNHKSRAKLSTMNSALIILSSHENWPDGIGWTDLVLPYLVCNYTIISSQWPLNGITDCLRRPFIENLSRW